MNNRTRSRYTPGTPGEVLPFGLNHFSVQSFRNREEAYSVDLAERTCSCKGYLYSNREEGAPVKECKHLRHTSRVAAVKAAERVEGFTLGKILRHLGRPDLCPEYRDALESELLTRETGFGRDRALLTLGSALRAA